MIGIPDLSDGVYNAAKEVPELGIVLAEMIAERNARCILLGLQGLEPVRSYTLGVLERLKPIGVIVGEFDESLNAVQGLPVDMVLNPLSVLVRRLLLNPQ